VSSRICAGGCSASRSPLDAKARRHHHPIALQRRFHLRGMQMVILPMRLSV